MKKFPPDLRFAVSLSCHFSLHSFDMEPQQPMDVYTPLVYALTILGALVIVNVILISFCKRRAESDPQPTTITVAITHPLPSQPPQASRKPKSKSHSLDIYQYQDETTDSCAICQAQMEKLDQVARLHCGHLFHEQCVKELIKNCKSSRLYCGCLCPVCRSPI